MKIKIIAPPVIDVSGLMRSPQYDIACLYSALSQHFDQVSFSDFRFFFYDDFYKEFSKGQIFTALDFREHKKIMDIILWKNIDLSYQSKIDILFSLFISLVEGNDILIVPFTIYQQFTIEYFLSSLYLCFFIHTKFPHIRILAFWNYGASYAKNIIDNFPFIEFTSLRWDENAFIKYLQKDFWKNSEDKNIFFQNMNLSYLKEVEPIAESEFIPNYSWFDMPPYMKGWTPLVLWYQLWTGCKNTCFYCYNSHKWGVTSVKKIDKIVSDILYLKTKYNTNLFHFCDDEINYNNTFLRNFAQEMINNNVDIFWTALIIPKDLDKDLLSLLYKAWCRQLRFWVESWSQRILDIIGKWTDTEEISQILKDSKEVGISTYASFIVDIPQESHYDITATLEYIYKNKTFIDNIVICAYRAHLWNYDQRYFQYLLDKGDYNFFRWKRNSPKKSLLRKFCDKLWKFDIDIIDFMKKNTFEF